MNTVENCLNITVRPLISRENVEKPGKSSPFPSRTTKTFLIPFPCPSGRFLPSKLHVLQGFFRRTVLRNQKFTCRFNKRCVIDKNFRCACRYCRYQKCVQVGMKREGLFILFSFSFFSQCLLSVNKQMSTWFQRKRRKGTVPTLTSRRDSRLSLFSSLFRLWRRWDNEYAAIII